MRNFKKNKGITLIALIITIVILLILAVVTIMEVTGDGIIAKAKEARTRYEDEQAKENAMLENYLSQMEGIVGNNSEISAHWTKNGAEVTNGTITLKLFDKIEYDEGTGYTTTPDISKGAGSSFDDDSQQLSTKEYTNENLEWRVLGVNEAGQLELISTNPTIESLYLYGEAGYLNAETKDGVRGTLDTFCHELYGQGTGAESARSLNIDDLNKLAGYNPQTLDTKYTYTISEKITSKIENDTILLSDFITKGEKNSSYINQWLASTCIHLGGRELLCVRAVIQDSVDGYDFWDEWDGYEWSRVCLLRPVVTLKLDAQFVDTDGNGILNVN